MVTGTIFESQGNTIHRKTIEHYYSLQIILSDMSVSEKNIPGFVESNFKGRIFSLIFFLSDMMFFQILGAYILGKLLSESEVTTTLKRFKNQEPYPDSLLS